MSQQIACHFIPVMLARQPNLTSTKLSGTLTIKSNDLMVHTLFPRHQVFAANRVARRPPKSQLHSQSNQSLSSKFTRGLHLAKQVMCRSFSAGHPLQQHRSLSEPRAANLSQPRPSCVVHSSPIEASPIDSAIVALKEPIAHFCIIPHNIRKMT